MDLGSIDSTREIAKKHATEIVEAQSPRNIARNQVVNNSKHEWHLSIEPWEVMATDHAVINDVINGKDKSYRIMVSNGDFITKEVRLFNKTSHLRFDYPIFESIKPDIDAKVIDVAVCVQPHTSDQAEVLKQIKDWERIKPNDPQPYYYEAYWCLENNNHTQFIRAAEHYLFRCSAMSMSVAMMRYNLAFVYCFFKNNAKLALDNLSVPLSNKPLMAENWCLLGDIHYFLAKDFAKAKRFYENAIIFGTRRKVNDAWPIQLSKYEEYPRKMIESCAEIDRQRQVVQIAKTQRPIR